MKVVNTHQKMFEEFFAKHGIDHEVTAPYTSQHNGITKRRNKTILDTERCMLKKNFFPKSLWGEVLPTVVYILNKCPTKKLNNKVLEEVWSEKRPSVSHLKVFGFICYKHVPDARIRKLDDKSESMILVGYHKTGAYMLFNPINNKTTTS